LIIRRQQRREFRLAPVLAVLLATTWPTLCLAGPPYVTDDPEPAPLGETELYLFSAGAVRHGAFGETESGIEANYGAMADVQLSAAVSFSHDSSAALRWSGLGLGVKYRFAHEDEGWSPQASFYPAAGLRADGTAELLLPVWLQKSFGAWTAFGGGGLEITAEPGSRAAWTGGVALTRRIDDRLSIGAEIYGETAEFAGESGTSGLRLGLTRELDEHFVLLGSLGPVFEGSKTSAAYYVALGWRG
jgi:hypothetical protein